MSPFPHSSSFKFPIRETCRVLGFTRCDQKCRGWCARFGSPPAVLNSQICRWILLKTSIIPCFKFLITKNKEDAYRKKGKGRLPHFGFELTRFSFCKVSVPDKQNKKCMAKCARVDSPLRVRIIPLSVEFLWKLALFEPSLHWRAKLHQYAYSAHSMIQIRTTLA